MIWGLVLVLAVVAALGCLVAEATWSTPTSPCDRWLLEQLEKAEQGMQVGAAREAACRAGYTVEQFDEALGALLRARVITKVRPKTDPGTNWSAP